MFKGGWLGKILRVNLSKSEASVHELSKEDMLNFIGGRGFAISILWSELKPKVSPLSPDNKLIFSTGPLTGFPLPSSGKVVVASKSPLTNGYGDGSLGGRISVELKKAGYDVLIVEGRAEAPVYLTVNDGSVKFEKAGGLWGKGAIEVDSILRDDYGRTCGTAVIGPAGENLVRFSTITTEAGRSGGRPGLGAVMGSKRLKALVVNGSRELGCGDERILDVGRRGYVELKSRSAYGFWMRQGTMAIIEWAQENSVLPTYNFREGVFDGAGGIDGYSMERSKVGQRGCPLCNMVCGNIVSYKEDGFEAELDYENVAMLGSNIGLSSLKDVAKLNKLCDELGLDTISTGSVVGFAMEAYEKGLMSYEGLRLRWGDYDSTRELISMIAYRKGLGNLLADGVAEASKGLGGGSSAFAMHVKGLEVSAYDCHAAPGMALAYATSPIGAHHKDAWFIALEVKMGRDLISKTKVEALINMQRVRGGLFETLTVCRFPWVELGLDLSYYLELYEAVTGLKIDLNYVYEVADRIYNLIRAFWVRELGYWDRVMDYPPLRWFEEPLTKGPLKGAKLSREGYSTLLSFYYDLRGWDERGLPKKETLNKSNLPNVACELEKYGVRLS